VCGVPTRLAPCVPPRPLLQEQVAKLRSEREAAGGEVAVLRTDLENVRGERDRLQGEVTDAKRELDKWVGWVASGGGGGTRLGEGQGAARCRHGRQEGAVQVGRLIFRGRAVAGWCWCWSHSLLCGCAVGAPPGVMSGLWGCPCRRFCGCAAMPGSCD